jgi:hypothetical protein
MNLFLITNVAMEYHTLKKAALLLNVTPGDMADPRGGVRHCVQGRGYY